MIQIFRKLRQRLLTDNKFSKYLLYAVGEIALVVIGILIALQIDNWNGQRVAEYETQTLLKALKADLIQDTLLITANLPEVDHQLALNESLRKRVAQKRATPDTLVKIMRFEFNPNWNDPVIYNTNAYQSLNQTNYIENLPDTLKSHIKNFYNRKFHLNNKVLRLTEDYRQKVADYVNRYTFGSTALHDQGPLIDSLVWDKINLSDLAAKFQGISNFKRIVFRLSQDDLQYSLQNSKLLIEHINTHLK
ncbi:DUF6090 family protein [Robiginitalea sp. IMCC43444]|uniref:DUF6090 family protein n=1 Tax=Robiginitalea sp. IMCC43444 TaxID=3459121 RepID=UPI0040421EA1